MLRSDVNDTPLRPASGRAGKLGRLKREIDQAATEAMEDERRTGEIMEGSEKAIEYPRMCERLCVGVDVCMFSFLFCSCFCPLVSPSLPLRYSKSVFSDTKKIVPLP